MRYVTYKCRDCGYIYRVIRSAPKRDVVCPICSSTKKDRAAWKEREGKKVMPDATQDLES